MTIGHPCPAKPTLLGFMAVAWALVPGPAVAGPAGSAAEPNPTKPGARVPKETSPAKPQTADPSDPQTDATPPAAETPSTSGAADPSASPPAEPSAPTGSERNAPAPEPQTVPEPTDAPTAAPEPSVDAPETRPGPAPAATPSTAPETAQPSLDPELLEGGTEQDVRPRVAPPPAPVEDSLADPGLHSEGRLPGNPTRFQLTARGLFTSVGANNLGGGRLGGTRVDLGQTWNVMGYALSLTALGGSVQLEQDQEIVALLGGGPTLTLGRFVMIGRGVADLRLGYDFFYAPGQGGTWAPHGPRVSMDMALLTSGRRFWQGFGVSIGYQALVDSFADDMPYVGMLSAGVLYWFG